jgi:hypothetical protein
MARPSVCRCEFQQVESEYIPVCAERSAPLGTGEQRLFKPEIRVKAARLKLGAAPSVS